jgi:hypothetical protein
VTFVIVVNLIVVKIAFIFFLISMELILTTCCSVLLRFLVSDLIWYSKFNNAEDFQKFLGEIQKWYDPNKFTVNLNQSIPSIWEDYGKAYKGAIISFFFWPLVMGVYYLFPVFVD